MKATLVDLIRRNRRIAATELATLTDKHKSTISPHLQELLVSGVLREAGTGESGARGGKPRQFLELNPAYCCAIGIDASADRLKGGVYDFQGTQVRELEYRYTDRRVGSAVLSDLYDFIARMLALAESTSSRCLGVGLGFSGHIDSHAGRLYQSRSLGLRDYDLAGDLRSRFNVPIILQNDANAALLGEKWFHLDYSGLDARDIVYFFIDNYFTSVGFGLMIGERLYEGAQSLAGELSTYSVGQGVGPELIDAMRSCAPADLSFVGDGTAQGSLAAKRLFDIYANELAYVFELLNPGLLVIGGNFDPAYRFFLEPFVDYARKRLRSAFEPYIELDVRASHSPYPPVCAGATVPLFRAMIDSL